MNGFAENVVNAFNSLLFKSADYSKVNEALANIPDDFSIYTDESVAVLNGAKNEVVLGKNITEQSVVDAYAKAIEDAITSLVKKPITDPANPTNPGSPGTGDNTNLFVTIAALMFSVGGIMITLKKRKRQ